jgi:hypothetical protein
MDRCFSIYCWWQSSYTQLKWYYSNFGWMLGWSSYAWATIEARVAIIRRYTAWLCEWRGDWGREALKNTPFFNRTSTLWWWCPLPQMWCWMDWILFGDSHQTLPHRIHVSRCTCWTCKVLVVLGCATQDFPDPRHIEEKERLQSREVACSSNDALSVEFKLAPVWKPMQTKRMNKYSSWA